MPGPLPDPKRRRRNAPTIPTTNLPASGRKGDAPTVPAGVVLGKAGKAYWLWAWHTPQSAAWGVGQGFERIVARRAMLEDDLVALERCEEIEGLLEAVESSSRQVLQSLITRLLGLATGRLAVMQKMLDIEDRLGLTPKGREQLRWVVIDDTPAKEEVTAPGVTPISSRRERLAGAG